MKRRDFLQAAPIGMVAIAALKAPSASAATATPAAPVNVASFGAVGDGIHDDTSAIQNAVASLPPYGGTVVFGTGRFKITGPIQISNTAIELVGSGVGSTQILQSSADASGIAYISSTTGNMLAGNGSLKNSLSVRRMAILRSGTNGGSAIDASWQSATDNAPYLFLEDVLIYGDDNAGNAWNIGVRLTNANGVRMTNTSIRGNPFQTNGTANEPYTMEAAIYLTGDTTFGHIDHFYTGVSGGYCNKFLKVDAWYEGLYFTNCEFVQVAYGAYVRGYDQSQNPVLYFANTHMEFRVSAIDAVNQYNLQICNCNLLKAAAETGSPGGFTGNAINLTNCQFVRIIGADITNSQSATSYGVVVDSASFGGNITGSKVRSFNQAGILLQGASGWTINGCAIDYCDTGIFLTNPGNVIGTNNYTMNGTDVTDLSGGNFVQARQWHGSVSGTFASSGTTQAVTVAVPTGMFSAAPSAVFATENFNTGLQLTFCYDRPASTATSIVLRAQRNDGSVIASGSNYSIAAMGIQ
jgi:hypothetical protein